MMPNTPWPRRWNWTAPSRWQGAMLAKSLPSLSAAMLVCGLHLNGSPFRSDRGIAVLGLNSAGDPWFSWASGPHATKSYGAAKLQQSPPPNEPAQVEPPQEPAAFYAPV